MDPIIPQPEQLQYQTQVPEPKHFLNKKFAITLVILLLLGVGASYGIWWWGNQNSQVAVLPATPDPTANWKTYTNTQYGFEIKYPVGWKIVDNGGDIISVCKDCVSTLSQHVNLTQVSIFPEGLGTEGPAGESRIVDLDLTQAKEKLVSDFYLNNNNQTRGYYISFSPVPAHWETYGYIWARVEVTNKTTEEIPSEGMPIVKLSGQVSASDFNIINQILSTFKFTR